MAGNGTPSKARALDTIRCCTPGRGSPSLEAAAKRARFALVPVDQNPIDAAWADQPPRPAARIAPHAIEFAGRSPDDKRREIAETVAAAGADAALITAPPSIAWAFNVRGGDVARTPLPLGRAVVNADGRAALFVAPDKVGNDLAGHLGEAVSVRDEAEIGAYLQELGAAGKRVAVDPALAPVKFVQILKAAGAQIVDMRDPCMLPPGAQKTPPKSLARAPPIFANGVAMARFLHWLEGAAAKGGLDEIGVVEKLEGFRRETGELVDISFDSISGAGANGAICHYRVSTETNRPLRNGELFLIDSGAQYRDGTTDITRTVPIGAPSPEMRDRFTRVLKGHIAVATARFPEGTTGQQLDALARLPLWSVGLDYDHGTGHGVGSFLGVHEGPQGISKHARHAEPLKPGMILSNEPGYYKAGEFGIRIENLVVVSEPQPIDQGERPMMRFETITLAPINLDLVVPALLNEAERWWLNEYHARVRQTITPLAPAEVAEWLAHATRGV